VLLATNQEAAEDSRAYNYGRIGDIFCRAEEAAQKLIEQDQTGHLAGHEEAA
jgi:hypothetical protein